VIAVGTSVVRALESAAAGGELRAARGDTDLVLGPGYRPRVVDGLLTGLHEPTGSHFALLQAFASRAQLERAYAHAEATGYLGHEFGDANLILRAATAV
jgi:S-adenosylmethionine:tRNA ribosyltransferase-isomerase